MNNDTIYGDIIGIIAKDARQLNIECIGSEMLLLALVQLEDSMTSLILNEMGVGIKDIKEYIEKSLFLRKEKQFTSKFKELITKTTYLDTDDDYVYDEAYLFSLLSLENTVARDIIKYLGLDEKMILKELNDAKDCLDWDNSILVNLTRLANKNKLSPFIGRSDYINRLDRILSKKQKNNAMLIGEAGVGKTGIVEGLAQKYCIKYPDKIIYRLDLGVLIAGTRYRGDLEERLLEVIDEVKQENAIVFIDEIHNILSSTSNEASLDIANILKPVLSRTEIKCIGATTTEEYYKYIYKDKALVRRFQNINVSEVTDDECFEILQGIKADYEAYYNVFYSDEILSFLIQTSKLKVNKKNPDKVIDLMDESGLITSRLNEVNVSKKVIIDLIFEDIGLNRDLIIEELNKTNEYPNIKKQIYDYLEIKNHKLMANINTKEIFKVLEWLKMIFKPSLDYILELDLIEYSDLSSVNSLIGSPAGYVGYENGGLLSEHIISNPFSIIVIRNIDNANPLIKGYIKRAIETGIIIDNKRRKISLSNCIMIIDNKINTHTIGFIKKT